MSELEDFDEVSAGEEISDGEGEGSDRWSVLLGELGDAKLLEPPITIGRRCDKLIEDCDGCEDSDLEEADRAGGMEEEDENSYTPPSLDSTPDFQPLESPFETHIAQSRVPSHIRSPESRSSPLAFFKLFVPDEEFNTFAVNTNAYAEAKGAGAVKPVPTRTGRRKRLPWDPKPVRQRPWHPVSAGELKVWFALLIFIGLVKTSAINLYWRTDGYLFGPRRNMSLTRFEQLKRFFHRSPPNLPKRANWYIKSSHSNVFYDRVQSIFFLQLRCQSTK